MSGTTVPTPGFSLAQLKSMMVDAKPALLPLRIPCPEWGCVIVVCTDEQLAAADASGKWVARS